VDIQDISFVKSLNVAERLVSRDKVLEAFQTIILYIVLHVYIVKLSTC